MLWTVEFWKGAGERAVKTFAQTLVGYIVIGTTGLFDVDWATALSVAGAAAFASLLTSIGNADFVAGRGTVELVIADHARSDNLAGRADRDA